MPGIGDCPTDPRCPGATDWRGFTGSPPAGAGAGPSGRIGSIGEIGTAGAMAGVAGAAGADGAGAGSVGPGAGAGAVDAGDAEGTGAEAGAAEAAGAPEGAGAPAASGGATVLVKAFGGNPRGGGAGGVRRSATWTAPPVGTSTLPPSLETATRPWMTRSSSPGRTPLSQPRGGQTVSLASYSVPRIPMVALGVLIR